MRGGRVGRVACATDQLAGRGRLQEPLCLLDVDGAAIMEAPHRSRVTPHTHACALHTCSSAPVRFPTLIHVYEHMGWRGGQQHPTRSVPAGRPHSPPHTAIRVSVLASWLGHGWVVLGGQSRRGWGGKEGRVDGRVHTAPTRPVAGWRGNARTYCTVMYGVPKWRFPTEMEMFSSSTEGPAAATCLSMGHSKAPSTGRPLHVECRSLPPRTKLRHARLRARPGPPPPRTAVEMCSGPKNPGRPPPPLPRLAFCRTPPARE